MQLAPSLSPVLEPEAFQLIFEMLPIGILVTDATGHSLFHNRAAQEILGTGETSAEDFAQSINFRNWHLHDNATPLSSEEFPVARALRGEEVHDELFFV